jgi:hypothetical protein
MPSNRAARDQAIPPLADFLRGQTALTQLRQQVGGLQDEEWPEVGAGLPADAALAAFILELIGTWPYLRPGPLSRERWERLCRFLAYLHTDLEPAPAAVDGFDPDQPRVTREARWHLLGVLLGGAAAWLFTWWLFPVLNLASLALFCVRGLARPAPPARGPFFPFADEEEWQEHRHHLDALNLPDYDPALYRMPAPTPVSPLRERVALGCGLAVMIPFLVLVVLVGWPLILVGLACQRAALPPEALNDPNVRIRM